MGLLDADEGGGGVKSSEECRFPQVGRTLADEKSSFGEYMKGAECKINKASLLIEACNLIDQMKIASRIRMCRAICMSICWVTCSLRGAMDSSARRGILSA